MALRGVGAGDPGMQIPCIYTWFGDFEALSLDSQSLRSIPSDKNAYEITLQSSDRPRSGVHPLGDFWETFGTPDDLQMTPR